MKSIAQYISSSGHLPLSWNLCNFQVRFISLNNAQTKFINSGCVATYLAKASLHSLLHIHLHVNNILNALVNQAQVCLNIFCHQLHLKLNNCISQYIIFPNPLPEIALSIHPKPSQRMFLKFLPE